MLEARIGIAPAREQALRDSIPQYLAKAVREHDVDLIASPEVEITAGEEEGPVEFDATCEVRPEITVPGYDGPARRAAVAGGRATTRSTRPCRPSSAATASSSTSTARRPAATTSRSTSPPRATARTSPG